MSKQEEMWLEEDGQVEEMELLYALAIQDDASEIISNYGGKI